MNELEEHHDEDLREFSSEELERMEAEAYDLAEEEAERAEEFARLEIIRDTHFARMKQLEKDARRRKIAYPLHEYMVDGLMPLNELHIIAGESGAGKSTWLLQM